MEYLIFSLASTTIAIIAIAIAMWQVRMNALNSERSYTLPVISETFREFRSEDFRSSVAYVITKAPKRRDEGGFASLPKEWRDNAYRVCYFFDYIGTLVNFGIIRGELVISICGNTVMQVWLAAEPFIVKEREFRIRTYPSSMSPGFLVYYEDLICRIIELGGSDAARRIQQRSGIRRLQDPVSHTNMATLGRRPATSIPGGSLRRHRRQGPTSGSALALYWRFKAGRSADHKVSAA